MQIVTVQKDEKEKWNQFVVENFPQIGAFMQTWEWGEFQQALGRKIGRYFVYEDGKLISVFMIVHHALFLGLSYGYSPRGPVIAKSISETTVVDIFKTIKTWVKNELPHFIFLRLEPPLNSLNLPADRGFRIPSYYIQPRYNLAVSLNGSEEEISSRFHPSTRSNLRRAEKRGVTVKIRNVVTDADFEDFFSMMRDTIRRNSGINAYPSKAYFYSLFKTIPSLEENRDVRNLSLRLLYGYQNGEPAGIHLVLFFGDTATYLYGASYSKHLHSKVTTYLHWTAIKESRRSGLYYYDLGGIDEVRWKTLTDFKRQFRGEEFIYIGNIDIIMRPVLYLIYNLLRIIKR